MGTSLNTGADKRINKLNAHAVIRDTGWRD
jgi:hypothetical protein